MRDGRDRPATELVGLVEEIIARDEREGGRTMRELAELIVERVLLELAAERDAVADHPSA